MKSLLGSESIIIRFVSLYLIGLVLFFASWTIAYLFLPEGLLRGIGILGALAGDSSAGSIYKEFIIIFSLNLIGFSIIILGNYILRVKYFAFGYLIPLAWMIMYAITLGTNSFTIPMEAPMAPSLQVFYRSGLYEMMAWTLFAVGTDGISINQSENFFTSSKPIPKEERVSMGKKQWLAVLIAILLLAGSAFREAYMIVY